MAGDQGAGPQVWRDPRPSPQLQNRQPQSARLKPSAAQGEFVDVLVEVHPGTRRQECLIGVERSVPLGWTYPSQVASLP